MVALLVSPHLIDLILAFTIIEGVFLGVYPRRSVLSRVKGKNDKGAGSSGSTDRPRSERDPVILANAAGRMHPRPRRGNDAPAAMHPRAVVLLLLPGICLLLAMRAVLAGAAWPWMPAALTAALAAHLLDLRERWRR